MIFVGFESNVSKVAGEFELFGRDLDNAMEAAGKQIGRYILGYYHAVTMTWNHKPKFDMEMETADGLVSVAVGTDDDIFRYVDEGTRPHIIRAKPGGILAFQSGYNAKTQPGSLTSKAGGAFGPFVFAQEVRHPGTRARGFTAEITRRTERTAPQMIEREIDKALTRLGR